MNPQRPTRTTTSHRTRRTTTLLGVAIAVAVLTVAHLSAFQTPDWSGRWISRSGRDVHVIGNVRGTGTAHGWDTYLTRLQASRDDVGSIEQTATEVIVTRPGGEKNMLTTPAFAFGDARET